VSWRELDAGGLMTCGRDVSDRVFCWGDNAYGEIADGTTTDRLVPTRPNSAFGLTSASGLAVGGGHVCAIDAAGEVTDCWGDDRSGQAGSSIGTVYAFWRVAAGAVTSCGVTPRGDAVCGGGAPLGNGTTTGGNEEVRVSDPAEGPVEWEDVSLGGHACGLATTGAVYCWGANDLGQLGDGSTTRALAPVRVGG